VVVWVKSEGGLGGGKGAGEKFASINLKLNGGAEEDWLLSDD